MFDWFLRLSVLDCVYLSAMCVAILTMLISYNRLAYNIKPLLTFACLHFLLELVSDYVNYGLHQSNLIFYHAVRPLSYLVLTVFFYRTFSDKSKKRNVWISYALYLSLVILYTVVWEPLSQFNSLAYMTESLFVIYWCFVFLRSILHLNNHSYRPERDRTFWLVIGLLFYYTGNFFTTGSLNYFLIYHMKDGFTLIGSKIYYAGYAFNYLFYFTLYVVSVIRFPYNYHEQYA